MGAYDCRPNGGVPYGMDAARGGPWDPAMDGGGVGVGDLTDRFLEMEVSDNSKASLVQVMKAVEAAENTIKSLLEENKRLKDERPQKGEEISRLRSNSANASKSSLNESRGEIVGPSQTYPSQWIENGSPVGPMGTLVLHQDELSKKQSSSLPNNAENLHYPDDRVNGSLKASSSGQAVFYNTGVSQFSTPSSRSMSPNRHLKEGEYDPITASGQQMNNSSGHNLNGLWKQDLIQKIREHEEEILQLKRHLADYSVKEEKIRNEKYVLEKRIAHMRMAFDQQQQELVDAASKALSYRQDIIEENIRLTYALQSAQQERSTFVSSLLPLLSEYGLQLPTSDANSIVSNLKVLFRHLHEKLIITEEKLKETQYQITPWRAEVSNNSNYAPQSPSHPFGMIKHGLEIVPQPPYSHAHSPITSPPNAQTRADWEALGHQNLQTSSHGFTKNEHENIGRSSPGNSNPLGDGPSVDPVAVEDSRAEHFTSEVKEKKLSFKDHPEMEDSEAGPHTARESSTNWAASGSPYAATNAIDDNTSYPYLPTVLEEPSSSLSEAAEDDPLPAIEGLQISGEAYPGRELQACGYSINGTTSCNFEWVRYLEDGSVNYIEGAKQPTYLVTADDVDSYLAIEVQPLDNRKRKGDLVKVFAHEQKKITCDPEMQEQIQRILSVGHVSFDIQIPAGALDIWENAVLAIKAEGYSIKCSGPRGVVVAEKFSPVIEIIIPYGLPTDLLIDSGGTEYQLRTTTNGPPRDTIVLTLRLFKTRAVEKKKTRKKVRFFK